MDNYLHIISFDVPYPANYGGVIDVYYKIKSLHQTGIKVILHCFLYNDKKEAAQLEAVCHQVYYYQRNTSFLAQCSYLPYTVYSRKNKQLLEHLLADEYPILFEGLMSCYYISHSDLANRYKIYRESNIEHDYYIGLSKGTKNFLKKLFYLTEATKLRFFEKQIMHANYIYVVSMNDLTQLKKRYPTKRIEFIPSFHQNNKINIRPGISDYILYHGNLSVAENINAVTHLCLNIFPHLKNKCIVSGLNPSEQLASLIRKTPNTTLIANPDTKRMRELIQNAQVNILLSDQPTGLKLKLLSSLFSGRHLIANDNILAGSGLSKLCVVANTTEEQINACKKYVNLEFTEEMIQNRHSQLIPAYSNQDHVQKIIKLIEGIQ